jgi:hypothetical protein
MSAAGSMLSTNPVARALRIIKSNWAVVRVLDHDDTAFSTNLPYSDAAIRAAAGEKHAYRLLMLILGKGVKEKIDGKLYTVALKHFSEMQLAIVDRQEFIRRIV